MGKQRATGVNNTDNSLGIPDIGASPVVQKMLSQKAALSNDRLYKPEDTDLITARGLNYDKSELDKYLPGGVDISGSDKDIEHQLGDAQGGFHQLGTDLIKGTGMLGIDLAKMVTNLASGVAAGTEKLFGNKDAFANFGKNSWDNYLNNVEEELKQALPIYSSTKYDSSPIPIFTSKFWTDDIVGEGLPFVIAQALGSKGMGAALGAAGEGLSAITKSTSLAELYNSVPITQRIASAVANKFTTGTVGFLNAASISAMQAKGTANQIEARMRQDYAQRINPESGSFYTSEEIDQQVAKNKTAIEDKTNNTFWATMAVELLPSIYASKLFLGASKAEMSELNTQIMKDVNAGKYTLEDIEKQLGPGIVDKAGFANTAVGKAASKGVMQSAKKEALHAATVGTVAMNLQQAIQKYDVDQAMVGNKDGVISSSAGYARQFLDNFTTDEGIKGLVMGAVLGGFTGAYGGAQQAKAHNEAIYGHLMSMRASDALFGEIPKGTEKTDANGKIQFDEQGNPIQDPEKLTKVVFQALHNKNNWDNQTAAIVSANQDMATMNDHVMLAQGIAHELQSGRYGSTDEAREYFKWFHGQRVKEQGLEAAKEERTAQVSDAAENLAPDAEQGGQAKMETQSAQSTGSAKGDATLSKRVNDSAQLIDKLFGLWDTAGKQANRLTKLGESKDRTEFNESVKRSLYYEAIKREAMKEMLLTREAEMREPGADHEGLNQQTEVLQNLMNDSNGRTTDFLANHNDIYEEWKKDLKVRGNLFTERGVTAEKFKNASTEENARAKDTAAYKFEEYADKEGINLQTGIASTDKLLSDNPASDIIATPIGSRNELHYKAGLDYMRVGRLSDMIDKVRTGELPLKEAVSYATDNLTRIDDATRAKLNELITEQESKVNEDEITLEGMDTLTDDGDLDPKYSDLDKSITERKKAIADSKELLKNKATTEELNIINRGPDKIEETLNKQFAEKQFDKAHNVLDAALDSDGKIRDTYTGEGDVAKAIAKLTRMRNAMEDRTKDGDLKGQTTYNKLIEDADKMIDKLTAIAEQVTINKANRDAVQKSIADSQAHANALGLGYDLANGEVTNPGIFNAANAIVDGKLQDMLDQLHNLPSGNMYEGSMAVLHAIKTKGTAEQVRTLLGLAEDQIAALVNSTPDSSSSKKYKAGMMEAPELYFRSLLQSFRDKDYNQASLNKGTPLGNFMLDNNIDKLQSAVESLPDDDRSMGTTKENVLTAIKAYKEIVSLNRAKNLLDSDVDLSKTVASELKAAADSSGIVPTAQQEISIRDGLAWLGSKDSVGSKPFSGWGFLRGIAGTGKTSVAVKWILDLAGLKSEEVIASAVTPEAAEVLGKATGKEAKTITDIEPNDLKGKKLVIIDEYARMSKKGLNEFEQKVREYNKTVDAKDRVRVMILGDPSQITEESIGNQDVTSADGNIENAKNIRVINPLTVVYRSDVSAISELSDKFQGEEKEVKTISVRSNKNKNAGESVAGAVGVNAASNAGELIDGIKANIAAEQASGNAPRTRVVITQHPERYAEVAAMGVPVIKIYDAQSQSYDEVYIDQDAKDFGNTGRFNTAQYTAVSRARQFVYIKHPEITPETNFYDTGLTGEKVHNDSVAAQAKGDYIEKRAEEKAMMEEAVKNNSIVVAQSKAKETVKAAQSPIEVETSSDEEDTADIVGTPESGDLPEPEGLVDADTGKEAEPIQNAGEYHPDATSLPNIEKGVHQALGGSGGAQKLQAGAKLHYMFTQEANGEISVTSFAIDPENGNWIPVNKVFKKELETVPKYKEWNDKIKQLQIDKVAPIQFDPARFNSRGDFNAVNIDTKAANKLGEGTITKVQRLTYRFNKLNSDLQGSSLAKYISGVFKEHFFSKTNADEQAKAENIIFRIFRHNELGTGDNSHKFSDNNWRPAAGIPYAIVNGRDPSRGDWTGAQFVRLTANALNINSEHYGKLKAYRDAVNDVAEATGKKDKNGAVVTRGIEPGTVEFNRMVRAAKHGLDIVDDNSIEGVSKKLEISKNFDRERFLAEYRKAGGDDGLADPIEHLSDEEARYAIAKMQKVASMIYGLKEEPTKMTPSEMLQNHGEDYEHIPLKNKKTKIIESTDEDGKVTKTSEPLGFARLKGSGKKGIPDKYITHWEKDSKKGDAQVAFNQIAKANEFVGDKRIRVDAYKRKNAKDQRVTTPEGKSLITEKGGTAGEARQWQSRKVLAQVLAETRIKSGELDAADASTKETMNSLESEIRTKYRDQDATEVGKKLLDESALDDEAKARLQLSLDTALQAKDSSPIDMNTLNLMTDPANYDPATGGHLTQQEFDVTSRRGTESRKTYLRTPLEIDGDNGFNTLGKDPVKNAEALSKMVGTKFQDILPTEVHAIDGAMPDVKSEPVEQVLEVKEVTVPGSKVELQDRIEALSAQIATTEKALDRTRLRKEQQKLIDERDGALRGFDENVHSANVGDKITAKQAADEVKRMLPNIKDSELEFLNKSLMLELQEPGESLLGLFNKGRISLLDDNGVYGNVVRHEVFHKVYNDYLSQRDREAISKEFDPEGKLNPIQLEEMLADKFMTWRQEPETFTGKIKRIFAKIANWLNFAQTNASTVDQLFRDIENGKFQKLDPDTANTRRAFSDIKKWGKNFQDYKDASRYLQNRIYDHFVNEHIDNMPVTQKELYANIQKDMMDQANQANSRALDAKRDNDEMTQDIPAMVDPEDVKILKEAIEDNNQLILKNSQQVAMLNKFLTEPKMMSDLWSDIYPNFNFKNEGIVSLREDNPAFDPESQEQTELQRDQKEASLYSDFIQSPEEKNQETKISQNVKNFLSFMYRPKGEGDATRINPRGVYLLLLRNLSNMQTSEADFITGDTKNPGQLEKRAAQNGINLDSRKDAAIVINKLTTLWNNAHNKNGVYTFNDGKGNRVEVPLPESGRFLNENRFVFDKNGKSLSGITEPDYENHTIIDRGDRSTADFLAEVTSLNLSLDQAKGYFRQYQAQETLREVMSNFTSQREAVPMIAEQTDNYGAKSLKYFPAAVKGEERVQVSNIENAVKEKWYQAVASNWKAFDKAKDSEKGTVIADLMKAMGLKAEHVRGLNSNLVGEVYQDIKTFKNIVENTAKELTQISKEDASDTDEQEKIDPVHKALEDNSNMLNRLTQLLSLSSSDNRAGSYIDAGGNKKYLFHNGNQAADVVSRIIRYFGDNIGTLPKHLTEDKVLSKNIFATGLNTITRMLDHDGIKQKGREEFAVQYDGETNKQWLERNFSYSFLAFSKDNASDNSKALRYVQHFFTPSNRPRINSAVIDILPEAKIHEALVKGIEQHVEQPDTKLIKNYDRFKAVNFDEFHKAVRAIHGEFETNSKEGRLKAAELYDKIAKSPELKAELASHMVGQLKELAEQSLQRMKKEGVVLGSDATKAIKGLKDSRRAILADDQLTPGNTSAKEWPSDEEMRPAVESFYMNNYVNSYFLNQTVAGNMNYFKSALDMVKRMSGVFAPGTKGLVGKFFMDQHYKLAVAEDPKMIPSMLSDILKDKEVAKIMKDEGFDLADGQGFMTQQRMDNILQGFGQSYKGGKKLSVFKPAHYENVPRTLEDGSVAYIPFMTKYSSVVLTESLMAKFPKLRALNDEMQAKGVHEFLMDSGVKVGSPVDQVKLPGVEDYGNTNITIKPGHIVTLSNENYRLQLNPSKEAYKKVANPTQLGYFLNTIRRKLENGTTSSYNADRLYSAVAEKIQRGVAKLADTALDSKGKVLVSAIKKGLTGAGNERVLETLQVLDNVNMPNIADKALISMGGMVDKAGQKIEFPGGSLTLQTSYGADIPDGKGGVQRLEYKQDRPGVDPQTGKEIPGRWYAEILLPRVYEGKINPGDFMLPDGYGFRTPSTGPNSSMPFRAAGFHDEGNVVMAPAELVALHGSDFDVDSMTVITRENAKSNINITPDIQFKRGWPVGYYENENTGKLEFDREYFDNEIAEAKAATTDPKILKQLEDLHDQMLTNQITEATLDEISHPDNLDIMTSPVSTQIIKDALDELGIDEDKNVNLSRLEDNLKVYNSNFQGKTLTGIFANGPKALSYLSRAGEGGTYPTLRKVPVNPEEPEGAYKVPGGFDWNGKVYDKLTETGNDGSSLWKAMEAFVNTAVDNVKEQYLHLMGATDKTGPAYIAAKGMGMPLTDAIRMMRQPVVRLFSEQTGSADSALDKVKAAMVAHALTMDKSDGTKVLQPGQGYVDLRESLSQDRLSRGLDRQEKLTSENLDARIGNDATIGNTVDELRHQMSVLSRFERLNKVGQDLSVFSSALGILQENPGFYEDIQSMQDKWDIINEAIKGESTFSFQIPELLNSQPNIARAYDAFQFYKAGAEATIIKHFPEVKALVDSLVGSKIRLLSDKNANREKIKNEVISYLISTKYSEELKDQKPVTVGPNKDKVLTGRNAWSQEFTREVEAKKKLIPNAFLDRMTIKKNPYGDSIRFANSSNPDAEEALEMQAAFQAIPDEKLQADFVKYAVLNFGLNFGMRNYSSFIPPEYLRPVSDYIKDNVQKMVTDSKLDESGQLISGPLKQVRDNLAIKMAVNNPDKLAYIDKKKYPIIQTVDKNGKPMTVDIGDQIVPVQSGYNDSYYWNMSYDNPEPKPESEAKFPEFVKKRDGNGKDVVYRRVNDVTIEDKAYYQKVGYKNYLGGYDGSMDVVEHGYNPDDYFAKGTIPVAVADVRAEKFEAVNEHIQPGSRVVVYPYSNATRELGVSGIVETAKNLGNGKVSFTLEKGLNLSKQLDGEETMPDRNQDHLMSIAGKVAEQAGIKLETSDKLPQGVKGTYQDGTVTLNPNLITPDTIFHEVSHPLMAAIEKQNPEWYQNLKTELNTSSEGREILNKVNAKYPELSKEAQEMEALVTAQGLEAAKRLTDSPFRTLVQRLMRSVGNMLRTVLGQSPTVDKLSLSNIGSADMVNLSIRDIADLLAGGKVDLRELSSDSNDTQYSKDLGDEKPAKNSVMNRILEFAKNIIDPARNEFGQEGDTYTVNGEATPRVSRAMDDFTFREKKEMIGPDGKAIPAEDAIAMRDADRMFRDKAPGETMLLDGIEKTKEEYQAEKKQILLTGIAKGNIIHAKIERFFASLKGDSDRVSELNNKIEELVSSLPGDKKDVSIYDWVTRKGVFNKLMVNAGINIGSHIPKAQEDSIYSEVKVASPTLGVAGKVDMMVEKPDGRLRIVDWKTGSKLKDKYSSTILKYGYQSTRITDNPLDRAKLQVMLYALTIKAEYPETKFDGLVVMHLPNESEATMGRNALAVEIPAYLKMLEQYYKNEKPEVYRQLLDKSPNLFDPREYNAPLKADFAQEVMNSNGSSEMEVKQKMELELQQLEYEISSQRQDNALSGPTSAQLQRRSELVKMIGQANDLYGTDFGGALDPGYEISILKRWMSTLNDTKNPYVQSLNAHLKVRQDRVNKEMAENNRKFDRLLAPVIKERIGDRGVAKKALTSVDYNRLFQNFYTTKTIVDDATGNKYIRRGMTNPEDHPTEYAALSSSEKALSDFMRTTMKEKYEKVMTKGEYAVVAKDNLGKTITKEDLYNSSRKGANFKWSSDFFPKLAITHEEVNQRLFSGKTSLGAYAKDAWRRFATDFFDNNAEGYNQRDYGLSVRYLGNSNTNAIPDGYSMNLENGYKKFMEQMIRKEHLDSTYMYGQAVKGVLENATDGNGNSVFKLSAGLVEDQLRNILMRDTLNRGKGKLVAHGFAVGRKEGVESTVSVLKAYRSLKSFAAAGTLWLQPQRSLVNAGQAAYMHGKEALVNSLVKLDGTQMDKDISLGSMTSNYAEAVAGQVAAFSGHGKSNFVHQLANELKLYNDLEEEGGKHNQYLTKGSALLDTSNFGFMYKMPEEVTNVQYALNYLKNLKIQSGKYSGKSMYDMYKENFNKETGKFELPADFKRGTIQRGDGTTEDLAGLHPLEINKIHAGIGKIMGYYRSDEKTAMQTTILGDAMMMFKRWIPGMAVQQYQSKYNDPTMGSFELAGKGLEQKPGEDVYQWRSRVVEGRMRTLFGFLMHYTPLAKYDGYAWSDLSTEQRKGVIDGAIAIGTWLTLGTIGHYTMSTKKDNDTLKKFYESMEERVQEEVFLPTMVLAAVQPPASIKKATDITKALWEVLGAGTSAATGGEDKDIYTERGDIRGMNELMKNVPLASSAYEINKSVTNWNTDDAAGTTSPF